MITVMIHRVGRKVGCGKDTDEQIPGRNVTMREKRLLLKVKNRMRLEENINSQSVVTLLLYSTLSKSSSHRQNRAQGTLAQWSLFLGELGKRNLDKPKTSGVLRQVA